MSRLKSKAREVLEQKNHERFKHLPSLKPTPKRKEKTFDKVCPVCKEEYKGFSKQKYCGRRCAARSRWVVDPNT